MLIYRFINYVLPRHGLGHCLGCRWAWALAQVPQLDYCGFDESYKNVLVFAKSLLSFLELTVDEFKFLPSFNI